jgi:hypothetical protein
MPIVVDEIVISVDMANEGGAAPAAGGGGSDADRQAIVAEAVERVLDILAEREER